MDAPLRCAHCQSAVFVEDNDRRTALMNHYLGYHLDALKAGTLTVSVKAN
jgi:hypothetical protein